MQSLSYWLVIGVIGAVSLGGVAMAFSGVAQNVAESGGVINVYNEGGESLGGTRYSNGLSADGTTPTAGQVRGTTLTVTGASTLTTVGIATSSPVGELDIWGGSTTSSLTLDTDGTLGSCLAVRDADGDALFMYWTANGSIATTTTDCR